MKQLFLLLSISFTIITNAQILKNTELTFSPFGVNTLGMNSTMDYQYGFATDILKFGGVSINGVNTWFDSNARKHEYYYAYPNVTPARTNTEDEGILLKSKKRFFLN